MNQLTPQSASAITLEEVVAALPANLKRSANQQLVDDLNGIASDPMMADNIRNNFVSYTGVLKDGKFKAEDYLSAVAYVSFKLMGDSNKEAWAKTFPSRHAILVGRGADEKTISAHVAAYARGQLVNKILEQSMVPTWVLNQDIFQKAINVQAELMATATSEKVRVEAANSILTHLKRPEAVKGQIDLNIKDSSGMNELKGLLGDLARQQRQSMEGGTPIKTITDSVIIENEAQPGGTGQAIP
jgi:hypothetical protein